MSESPLMAEAHPSESSRERVVSAVGFSVLVPGLGHWLMGRRREALIWGVTCQALLLLGFALAGGTQRDFGFPVGFGGVQVLFVILPELGNFLASQLAAAFIESADFGGRFPANLPMRELGYLLSGASGVLGCFSAAHAAGCQMMDRLAARPGDAPLHAGAVNPGRAALASLLLPGLGHWMTGRRFKAKLLCGTVLGLFLLGMALGEFADFHRPRHPYYWVGQMFIGLPGWLTALVVQGARFDSVRVFQDVGLLYTTSAGFFNIIVALDAYARAEEDLRPKDKGQEVGS